MESSANSSCKEGVKTEPDGLYENGDHTTPDIDEKYSIPSNKEDLVALYTEKYQAQKNGKTKVILGVIFANSYLYLRGF